MRISIIAIFFKRREEMKKSKSYIKKQLNLINSSQSLTFIMVIIFLNKKTYRNPKKIISNAYK